MRMAITRGLILWISHPAFYHESTPLPLKTIPTPWEPRFDAISGLSPESSSRQFSFWRFSTPNLQVSWIQEAKIPKRIMYENSSSMRISDFNPLTFWEVNLIDFILFAFFVNAIMLCYLRAKQPALEIIRLLLQTTGKQNFRK